jgi:hypothetical protein
MAGEASTIKASRRIGPARSPQMAKKEQNFSIIIDLFSE